MTINEMHAAVLAAESSLNKHYWTLFSIAYGLQAQRVFEFGAGGSSAVLLAALELTGGRLISCDVEPAEGIAERVPVLRRAIGSSQWTFLQMPSATALSKIQSEAFDLVLHDGTHETEQLAADIAGILPRLKQFGLLLVHDVEQHQLGPQVRRGLITGIQNSRVAVSMTSLPYSDGLAIVRRESYSDCGRVASQWCKSSTQPAVPVQIPWGP